MRPKIESKLKKIRKKLARSFAKTVYALPMYARQNPRSRLTNIRDTCQRLPTFPQTTKALTPNWFIGVRGPETIHRRPSLCLDNDDEQRFRRAIETYQDGATYQIPEVLLAGFQNARIVSKDFLVMTVEKRILLESALSSPDVLENNGIFDRVFWPAARRVPGSFCLLANPWANAYYHWVMDVLPRISSLEQFRELDTASLIVPANLQPFQRDSLALAGVPAERTTSFNGGYWQLEQLYFPSLLSPAGNPSPHAVAWLRARFLADPAATPSRKRLLYISRRDAPNRRLLNEDAVVDLMQKNGFEIICPGELTFREQIETFRDAHIVVGPHGAAFTNMVFAPESATLIELFGDNYVNGCFWALANLRGQKHACLTSPATTMNYTVSTARIQRLLDKATASNN